MSQEFLITLFQDSIKFALFVSAPCLLSTLLSGILMSIFQTSVQINEQTLSFIPKIISMILSCILFGPWMLRLTIEYIENIFHIISIMN
ncbi:Flagellar biosynthetic protein FliQ [Buchnera aphidicola (Cinara kochiana kochiana)]|uniref:Flagellar biosynthetic protein FliQ n=1 Tax=Buchnera aphidicola (Cinara kochiana kochiana) TaxID=2518976 RepID=A0A451D5J6_9GAMM|nr:flagellar biosynthetic protein FliQ [Buchnera aphidicola]VFP80974.1 Flagellar biosynthetic protein FliQ [Buchnera aphidicola (Cinara kochiana kochiana)]